jgi:hypothetical protein
LLAFTATGFNSTTCAQRGTASFSVSRGCYVLQRVLKGCVTEGGYLHKRGWGRRMAPRMTPAAACGGEEPRRRRDASAHVVPCTGAAVRSRRCVSCALSTVIFFVGLVSCGKFVYAQILPHPRACVVTTPFASCACPLPPGAHIQQVQHQVCRTPHHAICFPSDMMNREAIC